MRFHPWRTQLFANQSTKGAKIKSFLRRSEVGRFNELREGKILGTIVVYIQVA
jgi:hypothetical protein